MGRLHFLDYLRGIAALGIMLFHYGWWVFGEPQPGGFMARVGIYGVSVFYVLSGLTLYHVYYPRMGPSAKDVFSFFKRRVLRIFPLLWLVTLVAILLSKQVPAFGSVFLNLTGLFGFVNWDSYYSPGVWSIGNELVFYVFFPLFVLFAKKYKVMMALLAVAIFIMFLYFTFFVLNAQTSISAQWRNYVNPLNQVFLFLCGFLIGLCFEHRPFKNSVSGLVILAGFALFVFYPVENRPASLFTGTNRLVFTLSCCLVCLGFFKFSMKLPAILHKPLGFLGEASYSVYLVHPLVYSVTSIASTILGRHNYLTGKWTIYIVSVVLTLGISSLVYQYFEKFFMRLGRGNSHSKERLPINSTINPS